MVSAGNLVFLTFLLSHCIVLILIPCLVQCTDETDILLQGINSYRVSQNLTALTINKNAQCLGEGVANQFKDQPCTNTTGANTVPGTEPQFSNYPNLLTKCHLNVSNTQDGKVMPACVHNLVASEVLSNFTMSQYSEDLNGTQYTGVGIGSSNDWIVVVLTTNTAQGSFSPSQNSVSAASLVDKPGLVHGLFLLLGMFLLLH